MTVLALILERCDANVRGGFGWTVLHEVAAMGDWVTEEEAAWFARAVLEAGRGNGRAGRHSRRALRWDGRADGSRGGGTGDGVWRGCGRSECRGVGAATGVGGEDGARRRGRDTYGSTAVELETLFLAVLFTLQPSRAQLRDPASPGLLEQGGDRQGMHIVLEFLQNLVLERVLAVSVPFLLE